MIREFASRSVILQIMSPTRLQKRYKALTETAPEIDLTVTETSVTVSISDSDVVSGSLVYKLIAGNEECDNDALASSTTTYSDGTVIQVQESDHGSRLCFCRRGHSR